MLLIALAGVLGVAYLVTKGPRLYSWLKALQLTVIIIWIFHTALGAVSMWIVWSGFVWDEPRMFFTWAILIVAACGYLISETGKSENVTAVANIVVLVVVVILGTIFVSRNIIHPKSAILSSPDVSIKLFTAAITACFLVAGGGLACMLHKDTRN